MNDTDDIPRAAYTPPVGHRATFNLVLMLLETGLSLLLRINPDLRRACYPLAQKMTVVKITTYLPYGVFYATFSFKGILLDDAPPLHKTAPDASINAYSAQIVHAIVNAKSDTIDALNLQGDAQTVSHLWQVFSAMGLMDMLIRFKAHFDKKNTAPTSQDDEQDALSALKEEHDDLKRRLDTIGIENARLSAYVEEQNAKIKTLTYALSALLAGAVLLLIWILVR